MPSLGVRSPWLEQLKIGKKYWDLETCRKSWKIYIFFSFFQVDLRHIDEENNRAEVEIGVDLTEFYMSVEWDILEVPAIRNVKYYTCCDEPYLDITFNVTMRLVHIIKVQLF